MGVEMGVLACMHGWGSACHLLLASVVSQSLMWRMHACLMCTHAHAHTRERVHGEMRRKREMMLAGASDRGGWAWPGRGTRSTQCLLPAAITGRLLQAARALHIVQSTPSAPMPPLSD